MRAFARAVAQRLEDASPQELTTAQRKDARSGRLFIDIMRNAYAQTVVAPYAVRARPGAPVATPLHWDELTDDALTPDRFTLRTISKRLGDGADPWAGFWGNRYDLRRAQSVLDELAGA